MPVLISAAAPTALTAVLRVLRQFLYANDATLSRLSHEGFLPSPFQFINYPTISATQSETQTTSVIKPQKKKTRSYSVQKSPSVRRILNHLSLVQFPELRYTTADSQEGSQSTAVY